MYESVPAVGMALVAFREGALQFAIIPLAFIGIAVFFGYAFALASIPESSWSLIAESTVLSAPRRCVLRHGAWLGCPAPKCPCSFVTWTIPERGGLGGDRARYKAQQRPLRNRRDRDQWLRRQAFHWRGAVALVATSASSRDLGRRNAIDDACTSAFFGYRGTPSTATALR